MFHHFPNEAHVGRDCLVRSTDFTYSDEVDPMDVRNPVYAFLEAVTQTGYRRNNGAALITTYAGLVVRSCAFSSR